MKRYLASLAVILMMFAVVPALAQDQAPPPPNDQQGQAPPPPDDQEYGPYSAQPGPQSQPGPGQPDQGQPNGQPDQNQPGMARLSYLNGDVSFQRGDNGDWVAATVNTPIAVNDRVSTGNNARAEIQLDYADVLRMSGSATAKLANLTRTGITVQIGQGLVTYSVLKGGEANSEIDTPNSAVHPDGPGEYRILVNSDAETEVIVRRGSADISTPQGSTHVDAGQMITVAGTDTPEYKTSAAPGRDDWDSWNDGRDRTIESAKSWGHTNRYYTGSQDLDPYGVWSEVPDYGPVWIPQQGPDWAPYRDGRWVYEPYYGWTWVSYEPWGWAPYHYGRWFVYGGSWAWWPGPVVAYPGYYPIWSPAYVSFFGFGGGVGFGFGLGGFGSWGWLPCGPGDRYHPWWGRWGGRYGAVGFGRFGDRDGFRPLVGEGFRGRQFSNVDMALRNDRVRGGISSMQSDRFGRAAVSPHQERISAASFQRASLMTGKMPVSPARDSFSPSGRAANPASFRNAPSASQHFFNGSARANAGISNRQSSVANARGGSSFGARGNASVQSSRPGWRSFTPPSGSSTNRGSAVNSERGGFEQSGSRQAESRSSWQHYTPPSGQSQTRGQSYGRGYEQSNGSRGAYYNSGSRPPLNMRQPIVTPRSSESRGGYYGGRVYSAPRGGYPSGGYSARPSYSAPRGNSGGGGGYRGGGGGGSYHGSGGGSRGSGGGGGGHSGGHGR